MPLCMYICLYVCLLLCLYSCMSLCMSLGISGGSAVCWLGIQVSVQLLFIPPAAVCRLTIICRAYRLACRWPQHLFYLITVCYRETGVMKSSSLSCHMKIIILSWYYRRNWYLHHVSVYYCYYHYPTCESCVLQYFISYYECYLGSYLAGATGNIMSV